MANKKSVTLVLKKCFLPDGSNYVLEDVIDALVSNNCPLSSFVQNLTLFEKCRVLSIEHNTSYMKNNHKDGYFIHLTASNELDKAIVETKSLSISSLDRPEGCEFVSHDSVLFIKGNNIIAFNLKNRIKMVEYTLDSFFKNASFGRVQYRLSDVPNMDSIRMIDLYGVKKIDTDMLVYDVFTQSGVASQKKSLFESIASLVSGITGGISTDISEGLKSKCRLEITLKKGTKALEKSQLAVGDVAKQLVQDGEIDYTITLNNNFTLNLSNLRQKKIVDVDMFADTFNYVKAKEEILKFYDDLRVTNVISSR